MRKLPNCSYYIIVKRIKSNLISDSLWASILLLIFARPFISEQAFPYLILYYRSILLFIFLASLLSRKCIFRNNPLNYPILLLLISLGVSTIYSIDRHLSLQELYKLISGVIIFYLIASQRSKTRVKSLITTMIVASFLISLYGIYQYFFGFEHTLNYLESIGKNILTQSQYVRDILVGKRIISSFFSPSILAGYLIMIIPLSAGFLINNLHLKGYKYFEERKAKKKTLTLTTISLSTIFIALVLTKSMGGYLALVLALIVFFILSVKHLNIPKEILSRRIYPIAIIILVIIILIGSFILISRAPRLIDLTNSQNSITQRLNYWQATIRIIKDYPLTGIGLGNFGSVYFRYKNQNALDSNFSHNSFLQIWAETGMLGIIAFFWIIFLFFRLTRNCLKILNQRGLTIGLIAAGTAFLIHNLVDYSYFISQVSFHWWVLLGLGVSLSIKPR